MRKENMLVLLWIIFGYFLIAAIDTVLSFIVHIIFYMLLELDFSFSTLTFLIPILTLMIYASTAFLLIKRFGSEQIFIGIFPTKFPKKIFIGIMIIPIILNPITNKFAGVYAESFMDKINVNTIEYLGLYGWMHSGLYISKWILLITLGIFFLKNINSLANKN
jgi:hypothetical protein